jgi:hypothetical protein
MYSSIFLWIPALNPPSSALIAHAQVSSSTFKPAFIPISILNFKFSAIAAIYFDLGLPLIIL